MTRQVSEAPVACWRRAGLAALAAVACAVPVEPVSASTRGGDPALGARGAGPRAGGRTRPGQRARAGRWPSWSCAQRRRRRPLELWAFDLEARASAGASRPTSAARLVVRGRWWCTPTAPARWWPGTSGTGAVRWQQGPGLGVHPHGLRRRRRRRRRGGADAGGRQRPRGRGHRLRRRQRLAAVLPRRRRPGGRRRRCGGTLVAVPRQSQWVTLIDGRSGQVLADILSREQAATFVRGLPEGLFFGSRGVFLASDRTAIAERTRPAPAATSRPRCPTSSARCTTTTCTGRRRTTTRPSTATGCCGGCSPPGTRPRFADGAVVVHNFRFFFAARRRHRGPALGLQPAAHRRHLLGAHRAGDPVRDQRGHVQGAGRRQRRGRPTRRRWPRRGPLAVIGRHLRRRGFRARRHGRRAAIPSLAQTLSSIIWDPDKRFTDVRMFALEELTKLSGPDVTRELLRALDSGDVVPSPVLKQGDGRAGGPAGPRAAAGVHGGAEGAPGLRRGSPAQAAGVLCPGGRRR